MRDGTLRHCWSKKARRQRPNWSLTLLSGPLRSLPATCSCAYRYAAIRTLRNSHRGPLTRWKHSHLHVSKVEYVPSTPSSYPHHGTIKSYRDCAIRETQNGCQTIELFGLLQAGHYSPGCAKALTQVSPKRISVERSAFPASRQSLSVPPLPLCLHVGKRGVSAL